MTSGHKHGRSASVKAGAKRASTSKKANSKIGSFKARKADSQVGSHRAGKASANGSGYRSAKTGRYIEANAPRIKSAKKRSAVLGKATSRVKTTATVDVAKSRRSK
jgi:hypothetical protein